MNKKAGILSNVPAGRLGEAKNIAKAVAFLASDDAGYITGTTLHVNGGFILKLKFDIDLWGFLSNKIIAKDFR